MNAIVKEFNPYKPPEYEKRANKFKIIKDSDFAESYVKGEWFVDGILPKGEIGMIFGASGSGKSFWTIDLMLAIAYGHEWRGIKPKQTPVLYIAAEGGNGIKKRLKAYENRFERPLNGLMTVVDAAPNLSNPGDVEDLIELAGSDYPGIIVIDTLACVSAGVDENSSQMGIIIEACKLLAKETGAMVILIHHTGKDVERGSRGWSGLKGAMDVEISISGLGYDTTKIAKICKQKDGEDGVEFPFKLEKVWLEPADVEGAESSCVVNHDVVIPSKNLGKPANGDQILVMDTMQALTSGGMRTLIPRKELVGSVGEKLKAAHPNSSQDSLRALTSKAIRQLVESNLLTNNDNNYSLPITEQDSETETF